MKFQAQMKISGRVVFKYNVSAQGRISCSPYNKKVTKDEFVRSLMKVRNNQVCSFSDDDQRRKYYPITVLDRFHSSRQHHRRQIGVIHHHIATQLPIHIEAQSPCFIPWVALQRVDLALRPSVLRNLLYTSQSLFLRNVPCSYQLFIV